MFTTAIQHLFALRGAQNRPALYAVDPLWSALTVSLWLATVGNAALWLALYQLPDVSGGKGAVLAAALWVAIVALLFGLQAVFAGRWSTKILAAVLLLATAPALYFMLSYGIVIDPSMIRNTFQTDAKESADLLSVGLIACVVGVGLAPCLWLLRRPHSAVGWGQRAKRNALAFVIGIAVAGAAVAAVSGSIATLMRNHTGLRYLITPLNIVYGVGRTVAGQAKSLPFVSLGAVTVSPSFLATPNMTPVLALVVGETARADHFSLNGYARNTNPLLTQQGVISFSNAWSCGTNTADSVPCMFSHLGREQFFSRNANHDNLLDLLQKAGYAVLWLDNNSGCKGVCDRVASEDLSVVNGGKTPQLPQSSPSSPFCNTDGCFDEVLTAGLAQRIQTLRAAKPQAVGIVIAMHQLGSHGPAYYKRSPQAHKPFKPECTTNALQQCDADSIINAYDNSIAYTDRVLASVVTQLKTLPPAYASSMVYMSDHGESLGERGTYLHGLPYLLAPDAQKHVPLIVWFSESFSAARRIDTACVAARKSEATSHDSLFHSVLSLLAVQHTAYKPELDWFKPCLK
jgi:lipid A ethanolaminephosphotransferase